MHLSSTVFPWKRRKISCVSGCLIQNDANKIEHYKPVNFSENDVTFDVGSFIVLAQPEDHRHPGAVENYKIVLQT